VGRHVGNDGDAHIKTGHRVRDRGGRDPIGSDIGGNEPEHGAEAPPDIAAAATVSVTMASVMVALAAAAAVASTAASATADGSCGDSSGSDSNTGSSNIGDCSIGDCSGVCSGGNGCIGNGGISCDGNGGISCDSNGGDRDGDCGGSDVSNGGDGNVCEADLSPRRKSNASVELADRADKPRPNRTVTQGQSIQHSNRQS